MVGYAVMYLSPFLSADTVPRHKLPVLCINDKNHVFSAFRKVPRLLSNLRMSSMDSNQNMYVSLETLFGRFGFRLGGSSHKYYF